MKRNKDIDKLIQKIGSSGSNTKTGYKTQGTGSNNVSTRNAKTGGSNNVIGYTVERAWDNFKDVFKNIYKNSMVNAGQGYGKDALDMIEKLKNSSAGQGWNKSGIEQLEKTFKPSIEKTQKEKTEKGIQNIISVQQDQNRIDQEIEKKYSGISDNAKRIGNIVAGVGKIAPTMAMQFIPGVGTLASSAVAFGDSAGDTLGNDLLEGKTLAQAQQHAYAQAAADAALELASGGVAGTLKGRGAMKGVTALLNKKVTNPVARGVLSRAAAATGEGLEDVASTALAPLIKSATTGDEYEGASAREMADSFINSAGTSLLIGGAQDAVNSVRNKRGIAKIAEQTGRTKEEVKNSLKDFNTVEARKVAKALDPEDFEPKLSSAENMKRYAKDIDDVFTGKAKDGSFVELGETPTILQRLGAKAHKLTMTQDTARKIAYPADYTIGGQHMGGKHNLGIPALKQLPAQLENPLAVLKSKTQPDSFVVLTNWKLEDGRTVVTPIHLDKKGNITIDNRVASTYGKDINKLLGENSENVLWRKNDRSIDQLLAERLQLPKTSSDDASSVYNMPQDENYVNRETDSAVDNLKKEQIAQRRQAWQDKKQAQGQYDALRRNIELSERDKYNLDGLTKGVISEDEITGPNRENILKLAEAKKNLDTINAVVDGGNRERAKERKRVAYEILDQNAQNFKDVNLLKLKNMPTVRAVEAMFGESAKAIDQKYFAPIRENTAKSRKAAEGYINRIKSLKLKKDQYALAHLLGETDSDRMMLAKKTKTMEQMEYEGKTGTKGYKRLYNETKQLTDQIALNEMEIKKYKTKDIEKAQKAVPVFREIYEDLYNQISDAYVDAGYPPMGYIEGYFPHLREETDQISTMLKTLGVDVRKVEVPTAIAGLTGMFKPGRQWFGNAQERKSVKTRFDAAEGFDRYLAGAMEAIYHTNDVRELRAFNRALREYYSDDATKHDIKMIEENENIDLRTKEEMIDERLKKSKNGVPNTAQWLEQYTNVLAGKRTNLDRWVQDNLGNNRIYKALQTALNRTAANMVAINPRSWMTNFNPIALSWGEVSTKNVVKGMWQSMKNAFKSDGFEDQSVFLTNRKGVEQLSQSISDKVVNTLSHPMEIIDMMSSNAVVRGKYYDNIEKGMTPKAAMADADNFAARLISDRSKGQMPLIFENKNALARVFTQFQLEVNNSMQYMLKDLPKNLSKKGKTALVTGIAKYIAGSWAFNEIFEALTGSRATFDPIDVATDFVNDLKNGEDGEDVLDAVKNAGSSVLKQMPYISGLLDGGRYPVQSALPDIESMLRGKASVSEELEKLLYLIPPAGGSQIKRGIDVTKDYMEGGRFRHTKQGDRLVYGLDNQMESVGDYANFAKALVFGRGATQEAKDYYSSDKQMLSVKDTNTYKELVKDGMNGTETEKIIRDVNDLYDKGKKEREKDDTISEYETKNKIREYLGELDVTDDQRQKIYDNRYKDNKSDVNAWLRAQKSLKNNSDYRSLDKEDQSKILQNISRYEWVKKNVSNVNKTKDNKEWKDWSDWYTAENAGISPEMYATYIKKRNSIKGEKYVDKYGQEKTVSGTRKKATLEYINSLNVSKTQKMLLAYMNGYTLNQNEIGMSKNEGRYRVFEYIMSLDISLEAKKEMLTDAKYYINGNKVMWK